MRPFVELGRKFHTSDPSSDPQYLKKRIKHIAALATNSSD